MSKRVQRAGVPDIHAPFHPPVIEQLTPLHGPVGTQITVQGQYLAGWSASVSFTGQTILDGAPLAGDTVTATIPAGLAPGFHEVQVDIAHLHRRVFFFEVLV